MLADTSVVPDTMRAKSKYPIPQASTITNHWGFIFSMEKSGSNHLNNRSAEHFHKESLSWLTRCEEKANMLTLAFTCKSSDDPFFIAHKRLQRKGMHLVSHRM